MKIDEIELVSIGQSFPIETVKRYLKDATPSGTLGEFIVNYIERNNQRGFILTTPRNEIAAYAGFVVRLNGRVWQSKNAVTFAPYKGQALVAKIYQYVKQQLGKSIQSDIEQSTDGMRLWTKTLPSLGLYPMIYDTETGHILDPKTNNISMYPHAGSKDSRRYTWILERNDYYPEQNLLTEDSILMPYTSLWYNFKKEKNV